MTITTEANSNVVNLSAYRSRRKRSVKQPIFGECMEKDGTDRLWWLADLRFLVVLNIVTWGPLIWTLNSLTSSP